MNFNKFVKKIEEDMGDLPPAHEVLGAGQLWDINGKALQEGDIVEHMREDGEWIVISVDHREVEDQGPGQVQLAELGEGIIADAKDLKKVGTPYGSR